MGKQNVQAEKVYWDVVTSILRKTKLHWIYIVPMNVARKEWSNEVFYTTDPVV